MKVQAAAPEKNTHCFWLFQWSLTDSYITNQSKHIYDSFWYFDENDSQSFIRFEIQSMFILIMCIINKYLLANLFRLIYLTINYVILAFVDLK